MSAPFEAELWEECAQLGAPYAQVFCLVRALRLGETFRIDAGLKACVVTTPIKGVSDFPPREIVYAWGWLDDPTPQRLPEVA